MTSVERITVDGDEYVRAYPVSDGRCPHCGSTMPYWHPARVIAAARSWYERHGRSPSRTTWKHARPETPSAESVDLLFGRRAWSRMLELAGLPPAPNGAPKVWTKERIIDAALDFLMREGRWPRKEDWGHATPANPHYSQAIREFGTWLGLFEAARGHDGGILMIDASPVAQAVREYLGPDGNTKQLAELMEVDPTPIRRLINGSRGTISVDAADRILTAIDRPDVLAEVAAA